MRFHVLLPALLLFIGLASLGDARTYTPTFELHILAELPHDAKTFTQGLFFHDGKLYESTGRHGESCVRVYNPESGTEFNRTALEKQYFGEGMARVADCAVQLTWKSGMVFVWRLDDLSLRNTKNIGREAWGLAASPTMLYLSDGSALLHKLRPDTLERVGHLVVRDQERPISQLNELEWVEGTLLANIWFQDRIAVIDPSSGRITAFIDLTPLRKRLGPDAGVANGIAWDAQNKRLFLTGKNWENLFVVSVPGAPWEPDLGATSTTGR